MNVQNSVVPASVVPIQSAVHLAVLATLVIDVMQMVNVSQMDA